MLGAKAVGDGSVVTDGALLLRPSSRSLVALCRMSRPRAAPHRAATVHVRPARRHPRRDVELHGLGQRLHHRGRGREPAAHLSPRHADRARGRRPVLRTSRPRRLARTRAVRRQLDHREPGSESRGMVGGPPLAHRARRRRHDQRLRHVQRARRCRTRACRWRSPTTATAADRSRANCPRSVRPGSPSWLVRSAWTALPRPGLRAPR